jgi:uncharacterized protein YqeY
MKIEQLSQEIKSAMLQKNASRLVALRGIKSQIDLLNASGKEVTSEILMATLQKMVKQRKESADIYKSNDRQDLFENEMSEVSVIEEFLPTQMSKEEIEVEIRNIVSKLGSTSLKDIGKVMGVASKSFSGKADNKLVSEIVKSVLQ